MTHHATGAAPGPGGAAGVRAAEREPRHVPLRLPLQLQLRQRGEDTTQPVHYYLYVSVPISRLLIMG